MKQLLATTICLISIVFLLNCTFKPRTESELIKAVKNVKLPAYATSTHATVYILRPSSVRNNYSYQIYVDNPENKNCYMGSTKGEQYIYFYISPGRHRIYSLADNGSWLDLLAQEKTNYFIEQVVQKGIVTGFNTLKYIDIYNAKWYIKSMTVGYIRKRYY